MRERVFEVVDALSFRVAADDSSHSPLPRVDLIKATQVCELSSIYQSHIC